MITRRRTITACGMLLLNPSAPPEIIWHIGPPTARTDPFTTWAAEIMMARYGVRVRRVHHTEGADVLRTRQSRGILAPAGLNRNTARQLVFLLASPEAHLHANALSGT